MGRGESPAMDLLIATMVQLPSFNHNHRFDWVDELYRATEMHDDGLFGKPKALTWVQYGLVLLSRSSDGCELDLDEGRSTDSLDDAVLCSRILLGADPPTRFTFAPRQPYERPIFLEMLRLTAQLPWDGTAPVPKLAELYRQACDAQSAGGRLDGGEMGAPQ